MIEEADHLVW